MKKWKIKIAFIVLFIFLIVFFFSLYHIILWYKDNQATNEQIENLQNIIKIKESKDTTTTEMVDSSNYYNVDLLSVDFTNLLSLNIFSMLLLIFLS